MPDPDKVERLLKESPINPRTGRVWTLADNEIAKSVDAVDKRILKTKASALDFLKHEGFVTAGGKLSGKYGGGA